MQLCRMIGAILPAVLMVGLLTMTFPARRAEAGTTGKQDFEVNCAPCHGSDGKGHGKARYVIPNVTPPDLTVLSRNNGSVFPTTRVYKSIDGRNGIPSHQRFDMPFWGTTFQREGHEFTPASEKEVRARIMSIVEYVKSFQQK